MKKQKFLGILEFPSSIFCAADALGQSVKVSMAGHTGTLTLPSLPEWSDKEDNPLNKNLVAPEKGKDLKRGKKLLYWGRPNSYPSGASSVEKALLEISLNKNNYEDEVQAIYNEFPVWLNLFEQYVRLLTTQNTRLGITGGSGQGSLELLKEEKGKHRYIHTTQSIPMTIYLSDEDESLHFDQFEKAASFSSKGLLPRLEYRLLLQAYNARKEGDYRKSVIEAASALEVCITERIREEFDNQNITFGEELLKEYRMLAKRFKLLRVLGIAFPDKDYHSLILEPRNSAIHKAEFPTMQIANQVIDEVLLLLELFSPTIHEA